MNKSEKLIPAIIGANNKEDAVQVLVDIAEILHLSQNYTHLSSLKDTMEEYKDKFKDLCNRYHKLEVPRSYNDLHELRVELNFLFRDFTDDLSFEVNKSKIYHEERKTEARAISMIELKQDEEFQSKIKATSTSALRDILGASDSYKEYVNLVSYSYGLYQEYHKVTDAMKMLSDSLASECRDAQYHEAKDAK